MAVLYRQGVELREMSSLVPELVGNSAQSLCLSFSLPVTTACAPDDRQAATCARLVLLQVKGG